jgi:replicative DNA helicase
MKDINDLLLAGRNISEVPLQSIDLYVAKEILKEHKTKSAQEKAIEKFSRTVTNPLVRSDLARMLADEWKHDIEDVKEFLKIKDSNSVDELLKDVYTIDSGLDGWIDNMNNGDRGSIGWQAIDDTLDGIIDKEIIVLAAPSSNGKSELAIEIALNWIVKEQRTVVYFSLEMSKEALAEIFARKVLSIDQFRLRQMVKTKEGKTLVETVKEKLSKYLLIIDKSTTDMFKVEEYLNAINVSGKYGRVSRVVFDHFHLIPNVQDVAIATENANKCNDIAKRFNCAFLLLAQFSKVSSDFMKQKKFREFMLSDLKGATALEQILHTGIIVWRDYKVRYDLDPIERESRKYFTRIKIDKHRRGIKKGIYFTLKYDKETTRMIDITGHEEENLNYEE